MSLFPKRNTPQSAPSPAWAASIVAAYGAVLETTSSDVSLAQAAPLSSLPWPKVVVKVALLICLAEDYRRGALTTAKRNALQEGYASLALFIPDAAAGELQRDMLVTMSWSLDDYAKHKASPRGVAAKQCLSGTSSRQDAAARRVRCLRRAHRSQALIR